MQARGWQRVAVWGNQRSHTEQIRGLRGTVGDKRMELGFRGLENLEQKTGWGVDKGMGSRDRHGGAQVSFGGELRDRNNSR